MIQAGLLTKTLARRIEAVCKSPNCKHKKKAEKKVCSVPGCGGSFRVVRGLCNAHWLRWKKGDKSIEPSAPQFNSTAGKICSVNGCRGDVYAKGLCSPHYQRKLRNGSERDYRNNRHGTLKDERPDLYNQLVNKKRDGRKTLGSNYECEWKCPDCPKVYVAIVSSRALLDSGCPDCARKLVGLKNMIPASGESLLEKFPEVALCLINADPAQVKAYSRSYYDWTCKGCDKIRRMSPSNFIANQSFFCRKCKHGGHDQTGESFVYLIHRPGQIKYGIMNTWTTRLKDHERVGWELIDKIEATGRNAKSLEDKIKQALKDKDIPTGRKAFRHKFDGWSETFQEVDLFVRSIRELCQSLGIDLDAFLAA